MKGNRTLWEGLDRRGHRWLVQRYSEAMPQLVQWQKWDARGKLLDRVSCWGGDRWNGSRWLPGHPVVPAQIREAVERVLREGGA